MRNYIKEFKKAIIEREILDTNVFREKSRLKKDREIVLDKELIVLIVLLVSTKRSMLFMKHSTSMDVVAKMKIPRREMLKIG